MKGKKIYLIIEHSWNGSGGYDFSDAYVYENEEERDMAYDSALETQQRTKDYDVEWSKYDTEIL